MRWEIWGMMLLMSNLCFAQYGGKSMSLGGMDPESDGVYASLLNPAGMASLTSLTFLSGYSTIHVPGLQTIYLSAALPWKTYKYGILIQRTGDEWLNELKASLLFAHKLENTSMGLRINYHQFSVRDIDSKAVLSLDLGGIFQIGKNTRLSSYITNATLSKISGNDPLPTYFRIGLVNHPLDYLRLLFSLEKEVDLPLTLRSGIEYRPRSWIALRIGLSQLPLKFHFGFGLTWKKWTLDYGLMNHPFLNARHEMTLIFLQ